MQGLCSSAAADGAGAATQVGPGWDLVVRGGDKEDSGASHRLGQVRNSSTKGHFWARNRHYCPNLNVSGTGSSLIDFLAEKREEQKEGNNQSSPSWHFLSQVPCCFNLGVCEADMAFHPAPACWVTP